MKSIIVILGFLAHYSLVGQNNNQYRFPKKDHHFSQTDWFEIMSELVNDQTILNGMKGVTRGPIIVTQLPYVCFVNLEHQIILQFCPECIWIVDSCTSAKNIASVSITAEDPYGFHLDQVFVQDMWNPGDTANMLLFILDTKEIHPSQDLECVLIPVISNIPIPAYAVFPDKKKRAK